MIEELSRGWEKLHFRLKESALGTPGLLPEPLDESRVSSIARPKAWIEAQYAAMTDQLVVFGPP